MFSRPRQGAVCSAIAMWSKPDGEGGVQSPVDLAEVRKQRTSASTTPINPALWSMQTHRIVHAITWMMQDQPKEDEHQCTHLVRWA